MLDKSKNLLPPIKMVFDEMYEEWSLYDSNDTFIVDFVTETHARQLCLLVNGSQFKEIRYILKIGADKIEEMEDI